MEFNASPVLGPIIVGVVVLGVLYGSAVVQTYLYFQRFPKDSWRVKGLVRYTYHSFILSLIDPLQRSHSKCTSLVL